MSTTRTTSAPSTLTPRRFVRVGEAAARPPRASLDWERLRVRVGRNGIFFVLTFALLMMFSPYLVMAFIDMDERALVQDLARNPDAMAALFVLIACKMIGMGTIFAFLPLVKRWYFDEEVPAARPRPAASAARQKAPRLTLGQRTLLTHGALIQGEVEDTARWPKVKIRYVDALGAGREATVKAHPGAVDRPEVGASIALLIDPQAPTEVVAPSLLGVAFEEAGPVEEGRFEPSTMGVAPIGEAVAEAAINAPMVSTLRPVAASRLLALQRRLRGRPQVSAQVGAVALTPTSLIQSVGRRARPVEVRLDRPFSTEVTAWLVSGELAEVTVRLRQRSGGAGWGAAGEASGHGATIALRAELPQRQVSRALPLKQGAGPYVEAPDFARIWPVVAFFAAAHGDLQAGAAIRLTTIEAATRPKVPVTKLAVPKPEAQSSRRLTPGSGESQTCPSAPGKTTCSVE